MEKDRKKMRKEENIRKGVLSENMEQETEGKRKERRRQKECRGFRVSVKIRYRTRNRKKYEAMRKEECTRLRKQCKEKE